LQEETGWLEKNRRSVGRNRRLARCRKTDSLDTNRPTNRMTGKDAYPTSSKTDRLEAYV
jgi:hypothetical protein